MLARRATFNDIQAHALTLPPNRAAHDELRLP